MVTRTGKYYGNPFQVSRRVTHRGPLSLTLFNTVVDAGLWHWVTLVTQCHIPEYTTILKWWGIEGLSG